MYATQVWSTEPKCDVRQVLKPGEAAEVGSTWCSSLHSTPDGGVVMAEYYEATKRWIVFV